MLPSVQAQRHLLGQQLVGVPGLAIPLADGSGTAPPGGALLLPPTVDPFIGNINTNAQSVEHEENQQGPGTLAAPCKLKGMLQRCAEAFQKCSQSAVQQRGAQQGQPDYREKPAGIENTVLPG